VEIPTQIGTVYLMRFGAFKVQEAWKEWAARIERINPGKLRLQGVIS